MGRTRTTTTHLIALLSGVALAGGGFALAASTPAKTVHACYVSKTGALRVAKTCTKKEKALSLSTGTVIGPVGPSGPAGPAGGAGIAVLRDANNAVVGTPTAGGDVLISGHLWTPDLLTGTFRATAVPHDPTTYYATPDCTGTIYVHDGAITAQMVETDLKNPAQAVAQTGTPVSLAAKSSNPDGTGSCTTVNMTVVAFPLSAYTPVPIPAAAPAPLHWG